MLSLERHRQIIDLLHLHGRVRVTTLARDFDVTEETIRRDLDKLEGDGKLVRTHGGALPTRSERSELPFMERETQQLEAKNAIGRLAVKLVQEGDTIMLDASSTAYQLSRLLPDIAITVVTNALAIVTELASRRKVRTMCVGGRLDPVSFSLVGPMAFQSLDGYHVNKLFLSCRGIDLQRGLSVASEEQALLKRKMASFADQRILLADHSKFGVKATYFFGGLDDIDRVITDAATDVRLLSELRNAGVQVDVAENQ